jgi:hypothetical protein
MSKGQTAPPNEWCSHSCRFIWARVWRGWARGEKGWSDDKSVVATQHLNGPPEPVREISLNFEVLKSNLRVYSNCEKSKFAKLQTVIESDFEWFCSSMLLNANLSLELTPLIWLAIFANFAEVRKGPLLSELFVV